MKLLALKLGMLMCAAAFVLSCSPLSRSHHAIVMNDYGSMRYINGKPDKVHKKWKSNSYKPKNNRVAKRRTDW